MLESLAGPWEGVVNLFGIDGPLFMEVSNSDVAPKIVVSTPTIGLVDAALLDTSVVDGTGLTGRLPSGAQLAVDLSEEGHLTGEFEGLGRVTPLDLRRQHPDVSQYVRPRDGDLPTGDGPLDQLVRAIADGTYPRIDDVLVAQGDDVIFEEYFYGRDAEQLHTFQSCTKCITSLVFGIAYDQGHFESLDDPVWRYFPERKGHKWIDEQYDVSLHDLLCMSVGLDWNEEVHYTDPKNDNTRMNASGDYVGYTLNKARKPDWVAGSYEYQSGLTILLGAVIKAASGRYVDDLAREHLFAPLGIDRFHWLAAADGTRHTGGGLFVRPRDMLKLGRLVHNGGEYEGSRVVSADWMARSTASHIQTDDMGHGYQWFLPTLKPPDEDVTFNTIMAAGYGGQYLFVIPELDAIFVMNAHDFYGDGSLGRVLYHHVLPALREA